MRNMWRFWPQRTSRFRVRCFNMQKLFCSNINCCCIASCLWNLTQISLAKKWSSVAWRQHFRYHNSHFLLENKNLSQKYIGTVFFFWFFLLLFFFLSRGDSHRNVRNGPRKKTSGLMWTHWWPLQLQTAAGAAPVGRHYTFLSRHVSWGLMWHHRLVVDRHRRVAWLCLVFTWNNRV